MYNAQLPIEKDLLLGRKSSSQDHKCDVKTVHHLSVYFKYYTRKKTFGTNIKQL